MQVAAKRPSRAIAGAGSAAIIALGASGAALGQAPPDTLEEIVVIGSYIRRANPGDLASPVRVMDAEQIARAGISNIAQMVTLNTANTGSIGGTYDLVEGGGDHVNQKSANLRGLGPASTLVLLNGRRVSSTAADFYGNNFVNLATLVPVIEVERVETILDGASALYGSDAIAGVQNIITGRKFSGVKTSVQYTHIDDAPQVYAAVMVGGGNDKFHTVASLSYEHVDNLQNGDRPKQDFYNPSSLSQPGNFVLGTAPRTAGGGDVIVDGGVHGPINYTQLYNQTVAARIAAGADPAATSTRAVQFADPHCDTPGTGGSFIGARFPLGGCRFSYQAQNPLLPDSEIVLLHQTTTLNLSDDHEIFLEGRYYYQDSQRFGTSSFGNSNGNPTIPASAPYNPFGVDAVFIGRALGNNADYQVQSSELNGLHLVTGASGDLPGGWNYSIDAAFSRDTRLTRTSDTDLIAFQYALNGFGGPDCGVRFNGPAPGIRPGQGGCVYFSPFGKDQLGNDPAGLFNIRAEFFDQVKVESLSTQGFVSGHVLEDLLPGGAIGIATGYQLRRDSREVDYDDGSTYGRGGFNGAQRSGEGSRTVKAVFGEVLLPILPTLDVDAALRYESYGAFDTTNPKLGVSYRPVDWLSLHGSASTAFRAPSLQQSVGRAGGSSSGNLIDPLLPGDTGSYRVINSIPNPDLDPERSKNFNLGWVLEPVEGLRITTDYWNFRFRNQIALQNAQQVLNADPDGPQVFRDQFGNLVGVNIGYFNAGRTSTDGVDFSVNYTIELGGSIVGFRNDATYVNSYKVQVSPSGPTIDVVGARNANNPGFPNPHWRNNAYLNWDYGAHSAGLILRYTGSVKDDYLQPLGRSNGRIGSWTVFDAQYSYRFGDGDGYAVTIGARNLFDRAPPFASYNGYLPQLADPLGRQSYIKLEAAF